MSTIKSTFIITYDLRKEHEKRDYETVDQAMEKRGGVRLAQSVWGIELPWNTKQVSEWVKKLLKDKDRIIVLRISPQLDHDSHNALDDAKKWMKKYVSSKR